MYVFKCFLQATTANIFILIVLTQKTPNVTKFEFTSKNPLVGHMDKDTGVLQQILSSYCLCTLFSSS